MGEDFEMFSLLNHYLHFPFPSCATPGCYFPAGNLEFYSIFAQCALFPNPSWAVQAFVLGGWLYCVQRTGESLSFSDVG